MLETDMSKNNDYSYMNMNKHRIPTKANFVKQNFTTIDTVQIPFAKNSMVQNTRVIV